MKIIILYSLSIIFVSCSSSNILETSRTEKPSWVNSIEKDFIIINGNGSDFNSAKDDALKKIKIRISETVATLVSVYTETIIKQNKNKTILDFIDNFYENFKSHSISLRYWTNISIDKAKDFYWEKIQNDDGSIVINYYLMYPFSDAERNRLRIDWEKDYQKYSDEVNTLLKSIDDISLIEDLINEKVRLESLKDVLLDKNRSKIDIKLSQVYATLQMMDIIILNSESGYFEYEIRSGNKVFTTGFKPKILSPCLTVKNIIDEENLVKVYYDYKNCLDSEEKNYFNLTYDFPSLNLEKIFYPDLPSARIDLEVEEPIVLDNLQQESIFIFGYNYFVDVNVQLINKLQTDFIITSMLIEPYYYYEYKPLFSSSTTKTLEYLPKIVINTLNFTVNNTVGRVLFNQKIQLQSYHQFTNKEIIYASLQIIAVARLTGKKHVINFNNIKLITNW